MFLSIALIIFLSFSLAYIFNKIKIPGLVAMILTGIFLGPYLLDLIVPEILDISSELRKIALIIILLRAGLSLDVKDLKKVGRPAILLSFLPATFEIIIVGVLSHFILSIPLIDGFILGSVLGAVSPAVIIPRMIDLLEKGYGKVKAIPQLIMAGASIDDVYVIVIFTTLIKIKQEQDFSLLNVIQIPTSIILGIGLGILCGISLVWFFKKVHIRDTYKVVIILCLSFFFMVIEDISANFFAVSGLIAVITLGITILKKYEVLAKRLVGKFNKIWVAAEIMLFVLVGACVNINVLSAVGISAIVIIFVGLAFRVMAVFMSLVKTKFSGKEKIFVGLSYLPKATVQAAIGAIPLSLGIASGEIILMIAVLAIIITAPLGAILVDISYKKLIVEDQIIESNTLSSWFKV